ncbi:MAG: FKBP-type peptidyl-prolyl cis-trans isomerase [Fimbriimonadaceae bacterium]|mgnify:CR=1 FL=1
MIQIEEILEGGGEEAKPGDTVEIHYTGAFPDGKRFDSSEGRAPFKFKIGAGTVIQGFDLMVAGMRIGGTRKATIPPKMAYGSKGVAGVIPPDSTLVFEVELLSIV